jgi:hypothetical protein
MRPLKPSSRRVLSEVELQGDGLLLAFASVSRALDCAIEIQKAFAAYSAEHSEQPVRVRIGIHTGEPIRDADRFFGKTVILVSRIAGEAQGGEIFASSPLSKLKSSPPCTVESGLRLLIVRDPHVQTSLPRKQRGEFLGLRVLLLHGVSPKKCSIVHIFSIESSGVESSSRRFERGPKRSYLQTPGEEQHDQDKQDDSADSDSTTWPKGVIAAATAKQQKQDQNQ